MGDGGGGGGGRPGTRGTTGTEAGAWEGLRCPQGTEGTPLQREPRGPRTVETGPGGHGRTAHVSLLQGKRKPSAVWEVVFLWAGGGCLRQGGVGWGQGVTYDIIRSVF